MTGHDTTIAQCAALILDDGDLADKTVLDRLRADPAIEFIDESRAPQTTVDRLRQSCLVERVELLRRMRITHHASMLRTARILCCDVRILSAVTASAPWRTRTRYGIRTDQTSGACA